MPAEGSSANPIDLLGGATAESFAAALPPVLADPAFDAVIVLFVPTVGTDEEEVGAAISRAAATAVDKPVLCAFVSAKGAPASLRSAADVPAFAYPEAAARALGRAAERGEWLRRPAGTVPELELRPRRGARPSSRRLVATGGGWLDARAGAPPARGVRRPARAGARRDDGGRGRRGGRASSASRRPQDRGTRRAQDRAGRRRPRPRRRGGCARGGRASSGRRCSCSRSSAAAPSCWPARCRIRSSARSSRSAPAASSPS